MTQHPIMSSFLGVANQVAHNKRIHELHEATFALETTLVAAQYLYKHGTKEEATEARQRILEITAHVVALGTTPPEVEIRIVEDDDD